MDHNLSWSLGSSLFDIFLVAMLGPEQSVCSHPGDPGCQDTPGVTVQRAFPTEAEDPRYVLLRCDRRDLAELNHTLCADVLASRGASYSPALLGLCQALSSLSPAQVEQAWSNACLFLQALASPLLAGPDCPVQHRVARGAPNLQQLACNYNSWLADGVDAVLVALCSDNEREEFAARVCGDAPLVRKLLSDPMNGWLYGCCANSSADPAYLVAHLCEYEQWVVQPTEPVGPGLLEFCLTQDGPRLNALICQNTGLFVVLFSNPENGPLMPNCSALSLPGPGPGSMTLESCRYSEWGDPTQISLHRLTQCIRFDNSGFTREVCANGTFLNLLLLNRANAWLGGHCSDSLGALAPEPTRPFDIADWCDYRTWGERDVDDSVVGLCWRNDRAAFEKNVCCKVDVFEKLLRDPQNEWLKSVCSNINEAALLAQVSW